MYNLYLYNSTSTYTSYLQGHIRFSKLYRMKQRRVSPMVTCWKIGTGTNEDRTYLPDLEVRKRLFTKIKSRIFLHKHKIGIIIIIIICLWHMEFSSYMPLTATPFTGTNFTSTQQSVLHTLQFYKIQGHACHSPYLQTAWFKSILSVEFL
jgi:hypothetical protein